MKAILANNICQHGTPWYRPKNALILEWKVFDLDRIEGKDRACINIEILQQGKTYYCCVWITTKEIDLIGSGKGITTQDAVREAFASAGVSFDSPLPETDPNCRPEKLVEVAIDAIATELGVTNKLTVPFVVR